MAENLKIALVHDLLQTMGGAERVTLALSELYPEAPIYTLSYSHKLDKFFGDKKIVASNIQPWSWIPTKFLFPFYPVAIESLDLRGYDIVISSSNSYAKNILTGPSTLHLSYIHSPMPYVWYSWHTYLDEQKLPGFVKFFLRNILSNIRVWDAASCNRVDKFIANSHNIANRISKFYRRPSVVVYPPVDTELINPVATPGEYFLVVSRLSRYKKVQLAVDACRELDLPLVVIGDGEEFNSLSKSASAKIKFLGFVDDATKIRYLQNCRALIFPGEEDLGIVPVEAMAAGRPAVAYGKGGLLETVVEGKTGLFFKDQTLASLKSALMRFIDMEKEFESRTISLHASRFSKTRFHSQIKDLVSDSYQKFIQND